MEERVLFRQWETFAGKMALVEQGITFRKTAVTKIRVFGSITRLISNQVYEHIIFNGY